VIFTEAQTVANRSVAYFTSNVLDGSAEGELTIPVIDLLGEIREAVLYGLGYTVAD
jgi:hypothetical protein